ncbi:MAG TPA: hypothetical protein VLD16_12145, partial [Gaiellaceae bacterium]|nr:hypothetical protein [Gaiellaceae bacterium]
MTKSRVVVVTGVFLVGATLALFLTLLLAKSSGTTIYTPKAAAAETESAADSPGLGPATAEAYQSAIRTYPANAIPPAVVARARATFARIAKRDARLRAHGRSFAWSNGPQWHQYGPQEYAVQPGVTSFSGATNQTASRITTLVVSPDCGTKGNSSQCTVWAGVSGGGIWRTEDALSASPRWRHVTDAQLDQHSVGALTLDPTDPKHRTLYLGTGEGNHCSSGCESGVGVYKSTNAGNTWTKLGDTCVSNAKFTCITPGTDAFLGRGINSIAVDPTNPQHILVGSAQGVRGLTHTVGNGAQVRLEPGANNPGLYESNDGGATFTEVWDGAAGNSFGVTKIEFDPMHPTTVYAAAFDEGLWRRSPALDGSATPFDFQQVFKQQFGVPDRTMFDLTVKNGTVRIYLTDGTANPGNFTNAAASNFWRTDNGNQPAATLLASQATGATPPPDATVYPQTYSGWQNLTSKATTSPYFATDDFCTGQCWYDEDVYTPKGLPDTVYVIGSNQYGEQPCDTKGVGCGNGRSNGREVIYSTTAGDPDGTANSRTFTDLSYDATQQPAPWCAYAPYFDNGCVYSPNGIHPDQHAIAVNPSNPTQIFEGSDGGIIRTSGQFADTQAQCDEPHRNGGSPLPPSGSLTTCHRLLSRVPTELSHIDQGLGSTIQFWNVAIDPFSTCRVLGGTQDNGTWSTGANCDRDTFDQVIYGDGGDAFFDSTHPNWLGNGFTSGFGDVNFENGDPTKWVISTGNIQAAGETATFYWPQIADPNPPAGTHPIFQGFWHVWRSWAFGAGHVSVPQQTTPDIAGYEANCPEFVTSGANPACGDYQPMGGAAGHNTPGDLTGTVYGADRTGGNVSWIARDAADHGTLWAATSAGRIFVTHNADAVDPAIVTWHRIDSSTAGGSPTRVPTAIYVDPADAGHAWISYSGYNAATPTTPGHVFSVTENGTFTNLNVESGTSAFPTPTSSGDLPVADIVRDDQTRTLYVATDFGVLAGKNDGTSGWHVTLGMPRYEVTHLELQPSNR